MTRTYAGVAEDGSEVRVEVGEGLDPHLGQYWPPTGLRRWRRHGPDRAPVTTYRLTRSIADADGACSIERDGVAMTGGWLRLESDLSLFAADHLVDRVAIHGGLVSWRGVTLLLPGSSMVGKSTLCLALSEQGAIIRSDEYALVTPKTGGVTGWARPMRRRRGDGTTDRIELPRAGGPQVGVDLVAFLRYEGTGGGWAPMTQAETVRLLLANTVSARRNPDTALDAALALAARAHAVQGPRGEARDATRRLLVMADALARV